MRGIKVGKDCTEEDIGRRTHREDKLRERETDKERGTDREKILRQTDTKTETMRDTDRETERERQLHSLFVC